MHLYRHLFILCVIAAAFQKCAAGKRKILSDPSPPEPSRGVTQVLPLPQRLLDESPHMLGQLTIEDFRINPHRYYETLARPLSIQFTISFWVITQERNKIINSLARVWDNEERYYTVHINADGHLVYNETGAAHYSLDVDGGGTTVAGYSASIGAFGVNVSDGTWHHVVITKNREFARIYIDAVQVNKSTSMQVVPFINFAFCIAADCSAPSDKSRRLERGRIDEYRIYDTELAESDILALYMAASHEISPAPDDPEYNSFIKSIKRMCSGKVLGNVPLNYILDEFPMQKNDLVLEFGVWLGHSVNRIARAYPSAQVFGFDSFYGLPEDWSFPWIKGSFNVEGHMPRGLPENVELVAGWFNESLPAFLNSDLWRAAVSKHVRSASSRSKDMKVAPKIALLHIDCDLYSSTITVLSLLSDFLLPGSIVVFDELMNFRDYEKQEMRAFYEFIVGRRFKFEIIGVECVAVCQHVAIRIVK